MWAIHSAEGWWSNEDGWVDMLSADTFTTEERFTLPLPIGSCNWIRIGPERN